MPYYYNPLIVVLPGGVTLPVTGNNGDRFYLTTGDSGVYVCGGNNVWVKLLTTTSTEMVMQWGEITGTLADQADLQTALDTKVPTSRTVNSHALSSNVTVTKADVGLGNADNTSDANKPISSATQTALDGKQVAGSYATGTGTANGTNTGDQTTVSGNAGTATIFQTARNINGVSFNGSADITIAASGATLTGTTLAAGLIGTSATTACAGNDARLSDARTPTTHATSHKSGGSDSIALDTLAVPTDITTLNASTSAHGLMMKYPGGTTTFLRADNSFAVPTASIAAPFTGAQATGSFTIADGQFGLQGKRLTLTTTQRGTLEGTGRLVIS